MKAANLDRTERGYRSYALDSPLASAESYLDVKEMTSVPATQSRNFTPLGIVIGQDKDDATSSTAVVQMTLWDDSGDHARPFRLACNVLHPLVPGKIWKSGTTATELILVGM